MRPESEADLAELIKTANGPVRVRGGGTRPIGTETDGSVLETGGLSGVTLYEPGALTVVVKAGTPVEDLERVLGAEGQRLPFEPMDHRALLGTGGSPTVGGMVAGNVSGPRRIQAGACRDVMLGVRFVDGCGTVLKNGGRVMKNVTGYDLVKLMAGSWGTLGVLTEVAFKVLAKPEAEATLVCRGKTPADGVTALSAALRTPFDISGAAHLEAGLDGDAARTQVRIEGMDASVSYRVTALQAGVLAGFDVVTGEDSAKLWQEVRDVTPFAGQAGAVWKLSVTPGVAPGLTAALGEQGLDFKALYDWGGGLIWLMTPESGNAGAARIRQQVARLGGHATLIRGSAQLRSRVPVFQPQPAAIAAIEAGLRQRFDPRGILNAGLMAG